MGYLFLLHLDLKRVLPLQRITVILGLYSSSSQRFHSALLKEKTCLIMCFESFGSVFYIGMTV